MACLALSIQPLRGPDILLQTREWFPPARAAAASYSFQATREAFDTAASSSNTDIVGDDALTASSGQVVVGEDSKFRVVYRLVNSVYVLGISSADQDDCSNNVFDCTSTVNQAVSILVAACRGVDVTAEKVNRKYAEVYLALDAVLHGASSSQLSNLMAALGNAGTAAAAIVAAGGNATTDAGAASLAEVQARGADTWGTARQGPLERVSTAQVLAHTSFELPEALLQAGDAVMEAQGVAPRKDDAPAAAPGPEVAPEEPRDPFALPAAKGDDFSAGFTRAAGSTDSVAALAELSAGLATLDGGEGGPGFGTDDAAGFQDFEAGEDAFGGDQLVAGFGEEAFGGGFDGLALEESAAPGPDAAASGDALALALAASTGPAIGVEWTAAEVGQKGLGTENGTVAGLPAGAAGSGGSGVATRAAVLWVAEAVHAEFHGAALWRAGLQGELRLQAPPRKMAATPEEALHLAFRLDGAAGVKTVAVSKQTTTRVGAGVFHATIPPALGAGPPSPLVLAKYRLTAAATPLPLRLHLSVRRRPGGRVAVLLQYVANPALLAPLPNVLFLLSLPFSPEALHFSPCGVWVKKERQLRWTVPAVVPGAPPGRLRVALTGVAPQQSLAALNARVVAVSPGYLLSAMFLRPATEGGAPPFVAGEHTWSTGVYLAYPAEKATSVLGDEFSTLASGARETAPPKEASQNESMETGVPVVVPVEEEDGSMQEGGGQNSDFFQQPGTVASDGYDHVESASPAESQRVLRFDSFGFDAFGDEPPRRPHDELNRQKSSAFDSPKQSAVGVSETGRSAQPFSSQSLNFF